MLDKSCFYFSIFGNKQNILTKAIPSLAWPEAVIIKLKHQLMPFVIFLNLRGIILIFFLLQKVSSNSQSSLTNY